MKKEICQNLDSYCLCHVHNTSTVSVCGNVSGLFDSLKREDVHVSTTVTQTQIYGVVKSTDEHPEAQQFFSPLKSSFPDVLFENHLAKDVDPTVRGPFGVARIELKEGPFHRIGNHPNDWSQRRSIQSTDTEVQ